MSDPRTRRAFLRDFAPLSGGIAGLGSLWDRPRVLGYVEGVNLARQQRVASGVAPARLEIERRSQIPLASHREASLK